jgi:hypothetical protein
MLVAENGRQLARILGELAVEMQAQEGTAETLQAIVEGAVHHVPGARWARISMIQGRQVMPEVPTDPIVAKLDELQTELGEGPYITALREHYTVTSKTCLPKLNGRSSAVKQSRWASKVCCRFNSSSVPTPLVP